MTALLYSTLALRAELPPDRELTYASGMHVYAQAFDDPSVMIALEDLALVRLTEKPDLPDGDLDVVGPVWVDEDRARAAHETLDAPPEEPFAWPANTVLVAAGTHRDRHAPPTERTG